MSAIYESYKYVESNKDAVKTISSREVAEMMEVKRHSDMLAKIDKLNEVLKNENIRCSDYWIEGSYNQSGNGKENREYQVTKKGCELIAHKTEGNKGVAFTVKYMEKFEQMEQQISNPYAGITNNMLSNASKELRAIFMIDEKQQEMSKKQYEIQEKITQIEDKMTVDYELAENLRTAVNTRAVYLLEGKHSEAYKKLSKKLFAELYRDIKGVFKVNSYKNISLKNYDEALNYIERWRPSEMLQYAIQGANGQVAFEVGE